MHDFKSIEDFFRHYDIDGIYKTQAKWSKDPIAPFSREVHKKLSHGVLPGYRNYDMFYERYKSAVEILESKDIIQKGMKVLDVGSGEGFFKFFFDNRYENQLEWHGIEVWKERAEFCRHIGYNIKEVDLEKGQIPHEDQSFDMVLASHVIEHLPNPTQVLQEMGRVLKPNGVLLVATPTKPPVIAQLDSLYHRLSDRTIGDTQQAFTHNRIEKVVLDALQLPKSCVVDKRGFRIISGRKKLPLENWKWFYDMSTGLGKNLLALVPEINLIIQKPSH